MADEETIKMAEKSKAIEAERMKAARDLAGMPEDKTGLAYLDPQKTRGFSRSPEVMLKSCERMANISIVSVILGILFGIIRIAGSIVSWAGDLGMAGGMLTGILGAIHFGLIGLGVLTGAISIVSAIAVARKSRYDTKPSLITACVAIGLAVVYYAAYLILSGIRII